ncbi:MAG: MlaD family protein [Candidatus Dependentiae bacterium]|nr:MlaD family protein [Candidatus Dependentiae bacterium]
MQIKTETKVGIFVILAASVFMFMILGIGAFRFSSTGSLPYTISFDDVSGLSQKAEVKIAGVKVGWVENIELTQKGTAQVKIMVNKKYSLYDNAYAVVRQEGLIGTKYVEVIPGDPMLPKLQSGNNLARPGREAVSVDELLFKFKNIATHVEQVTESIKDAFTGAERSEQLKSMIENMSSASDKINKLAGSLDNVFSNNEDRLQGIVTNIQEFTTTLRDDLPALKENLTGSADSIARAADEAREGFSSIASVSQKIDEGRGLLGKMINEDDMYRDIKSAVSGIKNYLSKFESIGIIFDSHSENMHRPVDQYRWTESKGYFNVRIHTNSSYFYLGQLASSERGFVSRKWTYNEYLDSRENTFSPIPYNEITTDPADQIAALNRRLFAPQTLQQIREQYAYGLQVGKIYNNVALRVGLFEGAVGVGADYFIPLGTDKASWITTLEMFDFHGLQRLDYATERRPHLKWINRVFVFNNLYTTFGADDFVSHNASIFWGVGLRFADDDIKYLISKVSL